MEEQPAIWRVAANILNRQWQTADKVCGPPAWGLGEVLTTHHRKNVSCYEMFTQKASDLDWLLGTCILNKKLSLNGRYECIA